MSALGRRDFLAVSGAALAGAAVGGAALASPVPVIAVHDSRIADSARFAARAVAQGWHTFDVSGQHDTFWKAAREHAFDAKEISGLTRWSDWVALRGHLGERGFRVAREERLDTLTGPTLFAWTMMPA